VTRKKALISASSEAGIPCRGYSRKPIVKGLGDLMLGRLAELPLNGFHLVLQPQL
jgi:hypothetical protein